MGRQSSLGEFEQLVMLAVLRLDGDAFGVPIRREMEERTGRAIARGAVYTTLDRLASKGLLASELGDEAAGRSHRRYYTVTEHGIAALRETAAAVRSMWSGLESVLGER